MAELKLVRVVAHRAGDCFRPMPVKPVSEAAAEMLDAFVAGGDPCGVVCPQCEASEIRYNGNYMCGDTWGCGWAMCDFEDPDSIDPCIACEILFRHTYAGLMEFRSGTT